VARKIDIANVRNPGDDSSLKQSHFDGVGPPIRRARRAFTKHLDFDPESVLRRPLDGLLISFPLPERPGR
jgi:hypothetical protein